MAIRSYRDLIVWQKARSLATETYRLTKKFPKDELHCLILQMRRCAISIPSNIAEGYGRYSTGDYARFLHIAIGSLYELETQALIAMDLGYLGAEDYETVSNRTGEIEKMLLSLISKVEKFTH